MKWSNLFFALFVTACAQTDKNAGLAEIQKKQEATVMAFEKGNALMDKERYEEAANLFDKLIVDQPVTDLDALIIYNSGLSHYMDKNCNAAIERFRKVIRLKNVKVPGLVGRTLLKMGDVYVCLGQDDKTIVTLIQLMRGKYVIPDEIRLAELPAKLAAAYARNGNRKEAEFYFKQSEKGLIQLQNNVKELSKRLELLAKTLFLMGNINQVNTKLMPSDDYFTTIQAMQKYLYKAVELNEPNWSTQAASQIVLAYEQGWDYIDAVKSDETEDKLVAARNQTKEKIIIAQQAIRSIQSVYSERVPQENEPEVIDVFFKRLKAVEANYRNFIAKNIIGTSLTAESVAAEGLKRSGRVYNPDPILEMHSKPTKKVKAK